MKIEFKRENFLETLQIVNKAIKKGNLYQILDCVFIDASKDKIMLSAQDGKEISIKKSAEGEIKEKGKAAIDGSYLLDIIRTMPNESFIEIEVNDKKECIISCGNDILNKINANDESTYPNFISINKENRIIVNEYKIKKMLEKTLFSYDRSYDSGNAVLKGLYFNIKKENFTIKSMDGYIISIVNEKLPVEEKTYESVIPGSALEEMFKLLKGDTSKDVNIYFNEKNIAFEFNDTLFTSIIIPNKYIETDRIFNMDYSTNIIINKNAFLESLNRAITAIRENDNRPVIFDIKENKIEVNINTIAGDFHENINVKKNGKDLMIAFNARNLIKILRVIDDENINLYFSGAKQPVIIKDKQETYSYLLTPVKI